MVIAGTDDRVVPYDGLLASDYRIASIPETLEFWRRQHACTGQKATPMPHRMEADSTRTLVVEWTGCRIEGGLKLYRIEGGGHVLPALTALPPDAEKRWGRSSQDFDTAAELWGYFRRFKR
jgi:polyhydroxybutyrate depolymerase